jgi:hypothetical protein
MATLGTNVLTLADSAKRLDPDGKVAAIAELLSQSNEVLDDMVWKEGNLPTGEQLTVRTSLPTPSWRLLNDGVSVGKSTTSQVTEGTGIMECWSEVDKDLAELNGNTAAFRLSEAAAFLEGMNQEFSSTLFYGNSATSPEEFTGFSNRYNALTGNISQNVITANGSESDNSSVYLIVWGPNTVYGVYPKGSKAGLQHTDKGLQVVESSAGVGGSRLEVYQDKFQWKCGVAVKDWRYAVRIPNIDISNLVGKSSAADLIELMIKAIYRIPNLKMGKPAFYMNRSCLQMLDIQRRDDVISGGGLTWMEVDGKRVPTFRGIPIRTVDALTETEAAVS